MRSYITHHYNLITKKELISKVYFKNINNIPILESISLNINIFNKNKIFIIPTILALELLTNNYTKTTKLRSTKISLKLKKNTIIGCTVKLTKNQKTEFLQKLIFFVLPTLDFLKIKLTGKTYSFQILDPLLFHELESYFTLFNKINKLTVLLKFNTTDLNNIKLLLTSLKFLLK